ncbi:Rhodanese-like domain-containing protein [Lipomyces oligophaga]|uniref:Rhodanese-like domain-containing protein n=1 Tax=Lipomyces oligophaga TaxID=45792 RepID=UPI0034CD5602
MSFSRAGFNTVRAVHVQWAVRSVGFSAARFGTKAARASRNAYGSTETKFNCVQRLGKLQSNWKLGGVRFKSESANTSAKLYVYEDIKKLTENPTEDIILVDVREPAELEQEGFIPTAINIPYKSHPEAMTLSPDEFEETFGFVKPSPDKELVFYCLGGIRCEYAQELAGEAGYPKRGSYRGSWEDWVARENQK